MKTIWKILTFQKFKSTWFISTIAWIILFGIGLMTYYILTGQV